MSKARVMAIIPEKSKGENRETFEKIQKGSGKVPNIFQHMANSPTVLKAFMGMQEATGKFKLSPQIRSQIALTVAQANNCNYCLSAHTAIAGKGGMQQQEIMQARKGDASDPKSKAILQFAKKVVQNKGVVSDADAEALKSAGVNDEEFVEIIFLINMNMFTNYFNHIVNTPIDFPAASPLA